MDDIVKCYDKNAIRPKIELAAFCILPFCGFFGGAVAGIIFLVFLSPIWAGFIWIYWKQFKKSEHKITLTRHHIKVDNFSSEEIPLSDIKLFRLASLWTPGCSTPVLVVDFFDNSKYQRPMGGLNSKANTLLFKDGVMLDHLTYYHESSDTIVRELNHQLERSTGRSISRSTVGAI